MLAGACNNQTGWHWPPVRHPVTSSTAEAFHLAHAVNFGVGPQAICWNKQCCDGESVFKMSFALGGGMMPRKCVRAENPTLLVRSSYEYVSYVANLSLLHMDCTEEEAVKSLIPPQPAVVVLILPFVVDIFTRVLAT